MFMFLHVTGVIYMYSYFFLDVSQYDAVSTAMPSIQYPKGCGLYFTPQDSTSTEPHMVTLYKCGYFGWIREISFYFDFQNSSKLL